jgi:V/A-type H+-transporting ATPase subunit K
MHTKKFVITAIFITAMLIAMAITLMRPAVLAADTDPGITSQAETNSNQMNGENKAIAFFAAMASVGIACLASAYALGRIGSAAMGAMSEKPELGGRAIIFLGMAEGIAIYGLIIAIMILNKI